MQKINGVSTITAGNEGGTTKSTIADLFLTRCRIESVPVRVVEIDNAPRLSKRVSKESGGADIAKNITTLAPAPDHDEAVANERAAIRHYNPLWGLIKDGNSLVDQGAGVGKGVFQWWVANGIRERLQKACISAQVIATCIPESETLLSALVTAKAATDFILPGDSKLFIVFNEKDQPGGFKSLEHYQEYRELRRMCENGIATAIDIPSCRSDFYKYARRADLSIAALLERLGNPASFASICREVGLDADDELTIDQEREALDEWLAVANREIGKLMHPALKATAQAAE